MEHRELPRIGRGDRRQETGAADAIVPPPLLELEWRKPPRAIGYRRIILGLVVAMGLLGLGLLALWSGRSWLSRQSPYQLPFHDVQLVPAPPAWFRGGITAFLESVRLRRRDGDAGHPRGDTGPGQTRLHSESMGGGVDRVSYPPRGLRVGLQYREPVALVKVRGGSEFLLDSSARILPREDVDLERLGPVIVVQGKGLTGPLDPRPGATWKPKPGVTEISVGNGRIPDATKLAGFLVNQLRSVHNPSPAAFEIGSINPMAPDNRGLFLFHGENTWIQWGKAPGEESRGSLVAEEKWAAFRSWSEHTQPSCRNRDHYWTFEKEGLVHVRQHGDCMDTPPASRQPP